MSKIGAQERRVHLTWPVPVGGVLALPSQKACIFPSSFEFDRHRRPLCCTPEVIYPTVTEICAGTNKKMDISPRRREGHEAKRVHYASGCLLRGLHALVVKAFFRYTNETPDCAE